MALIKCIECNREISDKALACPYCGCPAEYQNITEQTADSSTLDEISELPDEWKKILNILIEQKSKLGAVVEIRRLTGVSLQEGVDIAEYMQTHLVPPEKYLKPRDVVQDNNVARLTICTACHKQISNQAEKCPHCGQPTGVHVCPKCGSTNTKVISSASKAFSVALWGAYAANKVRASYKCNDCWHEF